MSASVKIIFPYGGSHTCIRCRPAEVHRILAASAPTVAERLRNGWGALPKSRRSLVSWAKTQSSVAD